MANSYLVRLLIVAFSLAACCKAQVLTVNRIKDQQGKVLQQRYAAELSQLGAEAAAIHFPYPFYFSETLDVDEGRQKQLPLGSIHFDNFGGGIVLEITGNYYASYSSSVLNANLRARKTFLDVILPLLKVAVAHVDRNVPFDAYAFEIAHHVRSKVLKVDTEGPENIMLLAPRGVAERLARAGDVESQQAALLESQIFLNGEPLTLWLTDDQAPAEVDQHYVARIKNGPGSTPSSLTAPATEPGTLVSPRLVPETELARNMRERSKIPPDLSVVRLEKLQTKYESVVEHLSTELKEQAHFVDYAPPAFIAFRDGAYLQLNMNTELAQPAGSRYHAAALAFDDHISHLLRPAIKYFRDNPQFEGIDFSTTIHQPSPASPESVEFVVPFSALACYEKYDCTGQELLNRSVILINGERASLDLQHAEASFSGDAYRKK